MSERSCPYCSGNRTSIVKQDDDNKSVQIFIACNDCNKSFKIRYVYEGIYDEQGEDLE